MDKLAAKRAGHSAPGRVLNSVATIPAAHSRITYKNESSADRHHVFRKRTASANYSEYIMSYYLLTLSI